MFPITRMRAQDSLSRDSSSQSSTGTSPCWFQAWFSQWSNGNSGTYGAFGVRKGNGKQPKTGIVLRDCQKMNALNANPGLHASKKTRPLNA